MNDPYATSTSNSGSWLRRHLPKLLFVVVSLITASAVVAVLMGRRDLQAKPGAPDVSTPGPERVAAEKLVPPPVPDEQNFAATPFLAATLEKGRAQPVADWPDDFSRADQWPRRVLNLRDSAIGKKTGRLITDLVAWQKAFEQSQSLDATRAEIPVSDAPDRTANAQAAMAVLKALEPYQAVLEELQAASRRPQSRFNVRYDFDNPWATLFPHLAVVKRTSQLLRLKASAELAAGHAEPALRDLTLMLRLAECPGSEPTLISQLTRVACLNLAVQPLWEGLAERRWSAAQLEALQAQLQQFDFIADLKRVLEAERAWGNLTIALSRDKRPPGFSILAFDPKAKAEAWKKEAERAFANCPRDWFDAEQRNYNELFDERLLTGFDLESRRFRPSVTEANARFVESAVQDTDSLLNSHLVFAKELLIAPSKVHLKLANAQATVDLAILACALERHRLASGRYPDTLTNLAPRYLRYIPHDLISGQPLHYQRTEDGGFLLYSVGWNESDDHGQPAFLASGRSTEIQQGDWVWRYPAGK